MRIFCLEVLILFYEKFIDFYSVNLLVNNFIIRLWLMCYVYGLYMEWFFKVVFKRL